jgi:hypothetical protein
MDKPMIVVGDSHGRIFDGTYPRLEVTPCVAYSLVDGEKGDAIRAFVSMTPGEVILSAGEIDCRVHVNNQHVITGKSYAEIAMEIVSRLIRFIITIPRKVWVLGIPPPGAQENFYNVPNYATPEQHAEIYRTFHDEEIKQIPWVGINYIDMYKPFVGKDGHMGPAWAADVVHLKNEAVHVAVGIINEYKLLDWNYHCSEYQQDIEMLALSAAKKLKEEKEKEKEKDANK